MVGGGSIPWAEDQRILLRVDSGGVAEHRDAAELEVAMVWIRRIGLGIAVSAAATAAHAAETINYTYDVHGRLIRVGNAGGPASGRVTDYEYDLANNRIRLERVQPVALAAVEAGGADVEAAGGAGAAADIYGDGRRDDGASRASPTADPSDALLY